jgi:hypothetical protein
MHYFLSPFEAILSDDLFPCFIFVRCVLQPASCNCQLPTAAKTSGWVSKRQGGKRASGNENDYLARLCLAYRTIRTIQQTT